MDRLTFLRSIVGDPALLTLPPWQLLSSEEQERLVWARDAQQVFVFNFHVRGFQQYEGPKVLAHIMPQDPVDMVREYQHLLDANAVAVYWEGRKLGYLPIGENVTLAYMADHGMLLECRVVQTVPNAPPWEQCYLGVYLLVPSRPSFIAYMKHYQQRPDAGYKRRRYQDRPPLLVAQPVVIPTDRRQLHQVVALNALGHVRFVRLLHHLSSQETRIPLAVKHIADAVEQKGPQVVNDLLHDGDLRLIVTVLATDRYAVQLDLRGPEGVTSSYWDVVYSSAHEVVRAELQRSDIA